MSLLEELKAFGVDVDEGLSRMMGKESLYMRMLVKFADMMDNPEFRIDFDTDDDNTIIEKAHTIKGTTGNLSIVPLYEAYSSIVGLMREDTPEREKAKAIFEKVKPMQENILECIKQHSN